MKGEILGHNERIAHFKAQEATTHSIRTKAS